MCFEPQRRALFRHLNFQKCSEAVVLCAFWLRHVLRAVTACTCSTSQLPKVLQEWRALCILTWTCASRHNGVHFSYIATSKVLRACREEFLAFSLANMLRATTVCNFSSLIWPAGPRTRRFREPTFRPSGATIIG